MLTAFLSALDHEADSFLFFARKVTTLHSPFVGEHEHTHIIQKSLRLDECVPLLKARNEQGYDIYVCVQRNDGSDHRKAENIVAVRSLILDLDGAPLEPVLTAPLKPHVVVETSPGKFHCYWHVEIGTIPLHQFTPLQEVLIRRYGADAAVKDLSRVLRVPGFLHLKREPFLSRVVEFRGPPRYTAAQMYQWLPVPPPKPLQHQWNGKVDPRFKALVNFFQDAGWFASQVKIDGHVYYVEVTCPNEAKHSPGGAKYARLYLPSPANHGRGGFKCLHDHCSQLTIGIIHKLVEVHTADMGSKR